MQPGYGKREHRTALRVPRFEDGALGASTLILADKIESVPAAQIGLSPFVIGPYQVRPRTSREFLTQRVSGSSCNFTTCNETKLSRGQVYSSAIRF